MNTAELNIDKYVELIIDLTVQYIPKIVLAILLFIIGWWVINKSTKFLSGRLKKSNIFQIEVQSFFSSMFNIGLKILLLISIAGVVGVETTSFVGIIAAMSFAIGLALQGNLSNFAAGVMILITRPFRVGDEVKIQGYWSYVYEIQIFHTVLRNFDKTLVIIPNNIIMNNTIQNLSGLEVRSIKIKLTVPYSEDLNKVQELITEAAFSIPKVNSSKKPFFWIRGYKEYGIEISLNFVTSQEGFWNTEVAVNKAVIAILNAHNIKVAYPMGVVFGQFGDGDKHSASLNGIGNMEANIEKAVV